MSRAHAGLHRAKLHASLHQLSQPLTVVSLALTLAQASSNEAERALALDAALAECERAMRSVRQLRSLVDDATNPAVPVVGGTGTEGQWEFGGAA